MYPGVHPVIASCRPLPCPSQRSSTAICSTLLRSLIVSSESAGERDDALRCAGDGSGCHALIQIVLGLDKLQSETSDWCVPQDFVETIHSHAMRSPERIVEQHVIQSCQENQRLGRMKLFVGPVDAKVDLEILQVIEDAAVVLEPIAYVVHRDELTVGSDSERLHEACVPSADGFDELRSLEEVARPNSHTSVKDWRCLLVHQAADTEELTRDLEMRVLLSFKARFVQIRHDPERVHPFRKHLVNDDSDLCWQSEQCWSRHVR